MTVSEFSWFPLMKLQFGRHRFQGVHEVLEHSLTVLQKIPKKVPEVLPTVVETLDTLHKSEGNYFEGDNDYQ